MMAVDIPHYVNTPAVNAATAPELKLLRPQINYLKAIVYIIIHFLIGTVISFIWCLITEKRVILALENLPSKMFIVLPIIFAITLRYSLIWFVKVYQHYAKSETRLRCCMTPSCSEYAILALKKYGAIIGLIKTIRRLLRCHPPGGIDYP